jgi:hypothetical protein
VTPLFTFQPFEEVAMNHSKRPLLTITGIGLIVALCTAGAASASLNHSQILR